MIWHHVYLNSKGKERKRYNLPPAKRWVLCNLLSKSEYEAPITCVGYLKYMAGDKKSPAFITPGVGGIVIFWSDCLGDDFAAPLS
jgi:hypothetical protein